MISGISSSGYGLSSISTQASQMFKKLDVNSDGGIDSTEFAQISEKSKNSGDESFFSSIDTNGDGKIDETENEDALKKLSQLMDYASSGMATLANRAQDRFSQLDANGDGGIDISELESDMKSHGGGGPSAEEIFSKVDINGDGIIDESENESAMEKMGPPPPPPPGAGGMGPGMEGSQAGSIVNSSESDSFTQMLEELKNSISESGDDDLLNKFNDFLDQIQNSLSYGSQGAIQMNLNSTQNIFSTTA